MIVGRRVAAAVAIFALGLAAACGSSDAVQPTGHTHGAAGDPVVEWDAGPPPELSVVVNGNPESGWVATAVVDGFTFADQSATEHVPGEGHIHVFIDGQLAAMLYQPDFTLPDLDRGPHEIRMTLSRNDHVDYGVGGEVISASATVVVPGRVVAADAVIEVRFENGKVTPQPQRVDVSQGSLVEIRVVTDAPEMIHVHGYDLAVMVEPGVERSLRFRVDIRGIFEVEFERSGEMITELKVD